MNDLGFDDQLKKAIRAEERKKLKSFLISLEKTTQKPKSKIWLAAATVVFLLGLCAYFYNIQTKSPEELFTDNFKAYPNVVAPIIRNDTQKTPLETAFENYELGNYNKAIENFDTLSKADYVINFYKSVSFLSNNNPKKAIEIFNENLVVSEDWKDKYLWYLSLAYLKNNEPKKAKNTLIILSKEKDNFKKNETLALLKSIQ